MVGYCTECRKKMGDINCIKIIMAHLSGDIALVPQLYRCPQPYVKKYR
jgi:hypothetical protein